MKNYTQEEADLINAAMALAGYYPDLDDVPRGRIHRRLQKAVAAYKKRIKQEPDNATGMHVKFWINQHTEITE